MENNDFDEFCKIFYLLSENYSGQVTKEGLRFRFDALKRFSIQQIKKAATYLINNYKYTKLPTIAHFVEAIEGDQENKPDDQAEIQAMKVLAEIRRVGSYGNPVFADPVTADIVKRRFGWAALCQMDVNNTSFFVRDFKAAYLAYAREEKRKHLSIGVDPKIKGLIKNIGS